MVSTTSTNPSQSAFSVVRGIVSTHGVSGLYRGFGISLMTYIPGSSIWWGSYAGTRAALMNYKSTQHSPTEAVGTLLAATCAAICTTIATNPLDTIKTRVQLDTATTPSSLTSHACALVRAEGLRGLYRGAIPRTLHLTVWGGCIILLYEELKRRCSRESSQSSSR